MRKEHRSLRQVMARWFDDRRWLAIATPAILLTTAVTGAAASALPANEAAQRLSATEISALRGGADKYPYATLALLYLLGDRSGQRSGALYLASVPTYDLSAMLLGSADRNAILELFGMLQWSPYSDSRFFVQVRWSVQRAQSSTEFVEFRTEVLSRDGRFRHPPIEAITVLLRENGVRFLAPGEKM